MKQIALFIGGLGLAYATCKFGVLTYTLLEAGHLGASILAAMFAAPCAILSFIFIEEALD